jgi:hypothetical protein
MIEDFSFIEEELLVAEEWQHLEADDVQCAITALGKLLPVMFICLQERSGTFGSQICEEARTLLS